MHNFLGLVFYYFYNTLFKVKKKHTHTLTKKEKKKKRRKKKERGEKTLSPFMLGVVLNLNEIL